MLASNTLVSNRPRMVTIELLVDPEAEKRMRAACVTEADIQGAVAAATSIGDCDCGEVGVRVTDDSNIHAINREFLQHDYPTDVISFPYDLSPPKVDGELVVSIDTATAEAPNANWSVREELLLYVIHGTLHLVGFDDTDEAVRSQMRLAEKSALRLIGISLNE